MRIQWGQMGLFRFGWVNVFGSLEGIGAQLIEFAMSHVLQQYWIHDDPISITELGV